MIKLYDRVANANNMKVVKRTHSNRFASDNIDHKKVELEGQLAKTLVNEGNLTQRNWIESFYTSNIASTFPLLAQVVIRVV